VKTRDVLSFLKELWRKPVARILTSVLILAILLSQLPLSELWQTLNQVSPYLWTFVVAAFIGGHCLGVVKWRLFLNIADSRFNIPNAFRCYFAGLFANLFLPSIAGGDVVRAGLAIRANNQKELVILGGILDRLLDTSSLLLLVFIGTLYSPAALGLEGRKIFIWLLFITLGFGLCIIYILFGPRPKNIPNGLARVLNRFEEVAKNLLRKPFLFLAALTLSLLIQGGFVLLNVLLGTVCNIHLPLHVWFLAWPLAKLAAMLPISLAGIGVREAALAVLLARFGIPFSSSVAVGLLWESVLITGALFGGIFYFLSAGQAKNRQKLSCELGLQDLPRTPRNHP